MSLFIRKPPFKIGGGDWNQQVDILLCLLEVTAWVYDTNGYGRGGVQQCRDGMNLDIVLLYPLEHKMSIRTFLWATKNDRGCRGLWGRFPGRKAQHRAGAWTDAGSTGRLQMGFDTKTGFCTPRGRCQCSKYYKRTGQKILPSLDPHFHFFRPRNTLYSPQRPTMGREIPHQVDESCRLS